MAAGIVALRWLDRLTHGWTRRRILCVVLLILGEAAIAAMRANDWIDIVLTGIVGGTVSALLFAFVLRFDLRVVPAVIAAYVVADAAVEAMRKGTPQAWMLYAVAAVLTLAISWIATRYLVSQGEIREPAGPLAAAPGSE
jgi:hypothetical protein